MDGGVAQLAEQLTLNQWVVGSSPSASTILCVCLKQTDNRFGLSRLAVGWG